MKRLYAVLLLFLLTAFLLPATAQCPVEFTEPLEGLYTYPEGSTEADALYVYRYRYPQIAGDSDLALHINTTYSYAVEDALGFEVPMLATDMQPGDAQKIVNIDYTVTCATSEYLSIVVTKRVSVGNETTEVISGHVFALTGSGAGRIINLPVYLGLLDAEETDEWLLTRQTNKADKVVREMIWDLIRNDNGEHPDLYDDLTFEELEAGFYPEEDFYLTEAGEPCFYFQPGTAAPEETGPVTFTIPLWMLLDEM